MFIPKIPTKDSPDSFEFWWKMTTSAFLVLAGGVFAGLTIGLIGLDELHLRVLATSSEEEAERTNAQIVLNLMQRGRHWVLVVLLLSNVIINESLPIFLDSAVSTFSAYSPSWSRVDSLINNQIGGGLLAIVISATAIVCARHGLAIGARCAPYVLLLMYLFAPVAYPIAKILDRALGVHDAHTYKKAELKSFLQFHRTGQEPLRDDEIDILNGVLELSSKNVEMVVTPICVGISDNSFCWALSTYGGCSLLQDVVMLSSDTILDHSTIDAILASGYSRFPVHKPGNPLAFVGLLLIKKLLMYDPARGLPVSHFPLSILPEALPSINCFQALDYFQTGRAHLLLISRTPGLPGGGIGVITLEDVIEEMISEEIVDETDQYEDNQNKRHAQRMINATVMRDIVELDRSVFTWTPTIEPTQVISVNIETVPLLPGSSQNDFPQAYRYVYNSIGELEH
ncbi:uncharacterized protein BJ212DRAFT_1482054 [Suillus subaureus]|uniref:CNNM transmembrane domain-containing protein n=1 Tax=Suillus subaureus TaxID=48587 RepID=A0A9P7JCB5_9AGAM|nr:uncharacterized protein BJ212DRAFT_1482054 [Suillus subaureus]KAG1814307.1 hypothetical protein BJ212DRAFT_1482054 [Suillus subaureus]